MSMFGTKARSQTFTGLEMVMSKAVPVPQSDVSAKVIVTPTL